MDINQLPLEDLQKIFSYLSYSDIKVASLVCHRWNQASEIHIVRNGHIRIHEKMVKHLKAISNFTRNYQSITIVRIDKWEELHTAVAELMLKIPRARELCLTNILQNNLVQFYQSFQDWMAQFESLKIFLDDRFNDVSLYEPEEFILTLPNLKQLYWTECLYGNGQKTVTIVAPNLEYVYINDSLDASAVLKINSERIKYIRCTLYTKHFDDTFVGNFGKLETLILHVIHDKCDISSISSMPQLKCLLLSFGNTNAFLSSFETLSSLKSLKFLSIRAEDWNAEKCKLNMKKIMDKFENLECFELYGINIENYEEIHARRLEFIKLRYSTSCSGNFWLTAPNLRTLSLDVNILTYLQLCENHKLTELYVNLGSLLLNDTFERVIWPFLNKHKHIKSLTLMREIYGEAIVRDKFVFDCAVESIEHLELNRMIVNVNFFRLLCGWMSLKTLKIVHCTIDCSGLSGEVIRLTALRQMVIDCVQLSGTKRFDFPIVLPDAGEQAIIVVRENSRLYFKTLNLVHKEYSFQPFAQPKVHPILSFQA